MTVDIPAEIEPYLRAVSDPEIPVLSILDMGIVREVKQDGQQLLVKITPTYSGCPAMDMIGAEIKQALDQAGYHTTVEQVLSPAWTTDWLTEEGRRKLEEYGIAAPLDESADKLALMGQSRLVHCPKCNSQNTKMVSQFGSTACKALFQCQDCLEPFDYFKCLK
ncbi:MAG: phenylacetate-CoA oxygenase subunit PaaJ [Bacteroidetes bacterium]|nr:MAG: phenylacetate-CoA oxygenase subunit PaaJ [Bacteroidota bacterium]